MARMRPWRVGHAPGALGEAKELIVSLDYNEIDGLAPREEVVATQHLADRVSAMLTKLIRCTKVTLDLSPRSVLRAPSPVVRVRGPSLRGP
jgi:hypothetical protein